MSREWLDYAWADGPTTPNEKFVFMCLADHANLAGQCFPSRERIASLTCLSRTTVFRALDSLKKDGWVKIESGVGRGKTSVYQLIKRGSNGTLLDIERGSSGTSFEEEKGSSGTYLKDEKGSNGHLKGFKNASLYRLTKREPSTLKTSTHGESEKPENEVSPKLRPPLRPPDPLVNPEIRNWVDLIVCASPGGVTRNLTTFDVTPADRVAVLDAAKAETHRSSIDLGTALQGLLQAVEAQVAVSPPGELRFLGDVATYFKKRNYRKSLEHLNGKGNGNGIFRSKSEQHEETLRKFLGRGGDSSGVGVVDVDADKPRRIGATRLPKRVM